MAAPIIDHNLLTLDYWQDSVTYEGKTVPGGTIGCEALNIPDTLREKLAQASIPLQKIVAAIKENNLTAELLHPAKGSVLHMIQLAKDTPPFSRADAAYYNGRVEHIFSEEGIQNTLAYVQAAAVVGLLATFNEQFRQGVGITKIITLAEELPATIRNYKSGMTAFADELHKGKRTPDGYAQVFGRIFSGQPKLSLDDKSWQAFSNTTIQYVSAVRSAQDAPQLMRRMHYMSFVSMFRSDLYEGLCVGHAPRKCAVCGKWFLTLTQDTPNTATVWLPETSAGVPAVKSGISVAGSSGSLPQIIPSRKSIRSGSTRSRNILAAVRRTSRPPPQ